MNSFYIGNHLHTAGRRLNNLQQDINSLATGLNFARVLKAAWIDIEQGPRKFPELLQAVFRHFSLLS